MTDEDKKQAAIQAQIDKRAEAIRDEMSAKADAARKAWPVTNERGMNASPHKHDDRPQRDKPEPRREPHRASLNDHRAPSYGGQGIAHNLDMQRASNPAAYIAEKREALGKKAPDLERAAKLLEKPAPRPETDAGKAWQAEKLRNPETATAWHLGAAAVKNDLDNSPNALAREEHKMRLKADPVYKNGYENAQRWEAERKAELAADAPTLETAAEAKVSKEVAAEAIESVPALVKSPFDVVVKRALEIEAAREAAHDKVVEAMPMPAAAKNIGGEWFAKLEHSAAKAGAKLPDAAVEQHKERMVNEPEYRDAYSKAAAPLHAERQAEAAAAREQKQAEAAPAPEAERTQEKELDTGLTLGVGIGIN